MTGALVKRLEWNYDGWREARWQADTGFSCSYGIAIKDENFPEDRCILWGPEGGRGTRHSSVELAKSAAQSDFEARILSALSLQPTPSVSEQRRDGEEGWQVIGTADKHAKKLELGIARNGILEEIHIGGYRFAWSEDEASCWWSDQCDDEIVPTHWRKFRDVSAPTEGDRT